MLLADIVTHVGQYCAVATRHGTAYGDLVRLSTALFLIRPRAGSSVSAVAVSPAEVVEVTEIDTPRR
jgi:hypothetical protein